MITTNSQQSQPLAIKAVGMVSSIGLSAYSSFLAYSTRISRFEEIPFHDRNNDPIIGAPATEAGGNKYGYKRMAPMLAKALKECIQAYEASMGKPSQLPPVLISIGEATRPDYPAGITDLLLAEVQEIMGLQLHQQSLVFTGGPTGFFQLLEQARTYNATSPTGCIVASVDSLVTAKALQWLETTERLKTDDDSDGVIPGEAAAALWVAKSDNSPNTIEIAGLGFGEETTVLEKDKPNLAKGLAEAMQKALADAGSDLFDMDFRVAGITGEQWTFKEASTGLARIQKKHKDYFELWIPAEKLGDAGAALPACMAVIAAIGIKTGNSPGGSAILYATSTTSKRAASVIRMANGAKHGK